MHASFLMVATACGALHAGWLRGPQHPTSRLVQRASASPRCCASDDDRASLERLFAADEPDRPAPRLRGDIIEDLPLWRVQWPMLPGLNEVLNVHVPHYTHMFSQLQEAATADAPARFGHLLLPGGSASLSDPKYALEAGTEAPMIGVLMQVLDVQKSSDGRLQVVAAGLCRFEVLRGTQTLPYSRADVRLLPDQDEVAMYGNDGLDASRDAARRAAAAASLAWSSREVSAELSLGYMDEIVPLPLTVSSFCAETTDAAEQAAAAAVDEAAAEATDAAAAAAAAAAAEQANKQANEADDADDDDVDEATAAADDLAEAAANAAAAAAAASTDAEVTAALFTAALFGTDADDDDFGFAALGDETAADGAAAPVPDTPDELARGAIARSRRLAASVSRLRLAALVGLEAQLWTELISCMRLMRTLRQADDSNLGPASRAYADEQPIKLPEQLRLLLPPEPPADGWPEAAPLPPSDAAAEWMADYPPMRRIQRLSYVAATLTPELDRQSLLAAPSTMARLYMLIDFMAEARKKLAALVALRFGGTADGEGGPDLSP